jgi:two-component system, LytTR family, sensor kinase
MINLARHRGAQFLLIFAFWTFLGMSFAGQFFIASSQLNRPVSWQQALFYSLVDWYVFALLSIFPIKLARYFGFEEGRWWRNLTLHVSASLLFSLGYVTLRTLVAQGLGWITGQPAGFVATFRPLLFKTWHFNLLIYWVILTVYHALDFYRKYQERHSRSLQLENSLVEARLLALQMQLNPHFLYNTLHAISSLMYRDVEAADRMISRLSHLLRYALESTAQQEVPLGQELGFLRGYLEIEQARFGDRLQVDLKIEPGTENLLVPNLILQPLVENAIRYGIEPHPGPGRIFIQAGRNHETLTLRVRDSGHAVVPGPIKEGVGLSNTRARLRQLYGDRHSFLVKPDSRGGLEAVITLPCRAVVAESAP